jgi:hypothetical protein
MTARQVEEIMGSPLTKGEWRAESHGAAPETRSGQLWHFTRPYKECGDYWIRCVYFRDGVVANIDKSFYVD